MTKGRVTILIIVTPVQYYHIPDQRLIETEAALHRTTLNSLTKPSNDGFKSSPLSTMSCIYTCPIMYMVVATFFQTLACKSSELAGSKCSSSSRGNTLVPATALACSGVCRPICPSAQHTAACEEHHVWSHDSHMTHTHQNVIFSLLSQ